MASQNPCKKNDTGGYTFYVGLVSQADTKLLQANPTLAAGDVKISINDGAPANLGTLPVVDADFTKRVKVVLSQAETNGDNLTIIFSDAAGAEWCDLEINIQTVAGNFDDIITDTAEIGAAGAGLTAIPWNASWDTEVQSEVADGLNVAIPGSPIADSINERIKTIDDKLPSRSYLSGSTAATGEIVDKTGYVLAEGSNDTVIADAVWNALIASYGTVEATFGYILKAIIAEAEQSALFTGTPSDAEIASLALYQLGQEAIANFEDGTKRATLCKFFYPIIRDAVLRAYPWNFAIVRQTLALDAAPPLFGFANRFALPVDLYCLRVLEMEESDSDFKVEGRFLHTDEGAVKIKYIARITNAGLYDSLFIEAFIARLAATLAYPITRTPAVARDQWAIYEAKLREARTMAGMEGTVDGYESDDLTSIR